MQLGGAFENLRFQFVMGAFETFLGRLACRDVDADGAEADSSTAKSWARDLCASLLLQKTSAGSRPRTVPFSTSPQKKVVRSGD